MSTSDPNNHPSTGNRVQLPPRTRYTKFGAKRDSSHEPKHELNISSMSQPRLLRNTHNYSLISNNSKKSLHSIVNTPKKALADREEDTPAGQRNGCRGRTKKKSTWRELAKQIHSLMGDFQKLVHMIKNEIERTVSNAVKKLEKDIKAYMLDKLATTSANAGPSDADHEGQEDSHEEFYIDHPSVMKRFPVFRAESLTTDAEQDPNAHPRKASNFSHQIQLREQIKKGLMGNVNKKTLRKDEQEPSSMDHLELSPIPAKNRLSSLLNSKPSNNTKEERKSLLHERKEDQPSDDSRSYSRISRQGDRSASKEIERLHGRLRDLKKILEN